MATMNLHPDELVAQHQRAEQDWPFIHEVNAALGLPPYLLHAIGSRETNLTNIIGDGGHGFGVWQRDIQHGIPDGWMDNVRGQAEWSADLLAKSFGICGSWEGAANAYNSGQFQAGPTTGHDYGPDVMARRQFLEQRFGPPPQRNFLADDANLAHLDRHLDDVTRDLGQHLDAARDQLRRALGP